MNAFAACNKQVRSETRVRAMNKQITGLLTEALLTHFESGHWRSILNDRGSPLPLLSSRRAETLETGGLRSQIGSMWTHR